MIKQILGYLKAWARGDDAELHIDKTWSFTWWEAGAMLVIVGLVVYWIWN